MYRSASVPSDFEHLEISNLQNYINILQDKLEAETEINIKNADTICNLQNQLHEKNRTIETLLATEKPIKPQRKVSKQIQDKQLFYKKNKSNPDVIEKVNALYGKEFREAGIPIPWQIYKSYTDKLFKEIQAA